MTAHSWSKLFRRKSARRIRGLGAVYELSPAGGGAWAESILHDFAGPSDGETPFQNPVFDNSGNLYGTTYNGGQTSSCTGCGTVYQLAPMGRGRWRESVVYDFASRPGGADGYQPLAGLMIDANGNFYGTTTKGGDVQGERPCNCGVVFQLTP
jgi:uncharacterized repeat protein (TIGR03803 family)